MTDYHEPPDRASFLRRLVELANATRAQLDDTMTPIYRTSDAAEVVFGVWQDVAEPHGVGAYLVKGEPHIMEIERGRFGVRGRLVSSRPSRILVPSKRSLCAGTSSSVTPFRPGGRDGPPGQRITSSPHPLVGFRGARSPVRRLSHHLRGRTSST
jgi:hypothetical protein